MRKFIASAVLLLFAFTLTAAAQAPESDLSYVSGVFVAKSFIPSTPNKIFNSGSQIAAGSSVSIPLQQGTVTTRDGRSISPYAPGIRVNIGAGSTQETSTITSVSGCINGAAPGACVIVVGSTSNIHGNAEPVTTGSSGLDEAIANAGSRGGTVVVDNTWASAGGTSSTITGATPYPNITIMDTRGPSVQYWNLGPSASTAIATPTTLVAATVAPCPLTGACGTVAGSASWGSTTHACISYVDIMGQEGPCSADYSFTSTTLLAIGFTAPAASTGAVGYKIYLSVSGGTYALSYDIPLLTQAGVSTGVCTLTTIETVTPACAVTNSTYNQTGSAAVVTGYPVVTSQLAPEAGSASATTYNANGGGRTTYVYMPGSHVGIPGVVAWSQPFLTTAAAQTTIGEIAGSVNLPVGFMNYVGRKIEVCGNVVKTSTVADTVTSFSLYWDAEGSNTSAGTPVLIGKVQTTWPTALAAAAAIRFCFRPTTTVAASTATGGTIFVDDGAMSGGQTSAGANPGAGVLLTTAAVGSLNLALNSRLSILYTHTTGTDGAGVTLNGLTVNVLN